MLKLSHPTPRSHCRAVSFAVHCTADGSFRQRWYSSLAERSPQESSFVGTSSVFLSAPSKACLGEQQQLQFTGTYSSSPQTAPAIPDGESLSSPASLEIPRVGLGKYLTCSSAHQKSVTGFQPNLQSPSIDASCATMRVSAGTGRKTMEAYCWGGQHHRSPGQLKLSQAHTRVDPWKWNPRTGMKASLYLFWENNLENTIFSHYFSGCWSPSLSSFPPL